MSIIINGVNIPITGDFITYNGVNIDKVICDGAVVWEKQKDITITSTNHHGLPVTGDPWSKDYHSQNESLDGTIYSIQIKIDLTSYSKIRLSIYGYHKASVNNTGYITVRLRASSSVSKSISRDLAKAFKEDDGSDGHDEKSETIFLELDTSSITGEASVNIFMTIHHTANQLCEGNVWGRYRINSIEFLS